MSKGLKFSLIFLLLIIILFILNLFFGSVSIPINSVIEILLGREAEKRAWTYIVLESRLPQSITALFTGGALAVSGLLLQTVFRNPLADSGILGVSSGASLGVAFIILFLGTGMGAAGGFNLSYSMTIVLGAFIGAGLVLVIIMGFASIVRNNIMLLIIGIMVGYLTSSVISILKFWSTTDTAFSYMMWGMGSFANVSSQQLVFYCSVIIFGLGLSVMLVKPLNALLLGERYAANLGVNIRIIRLLLLICAGLLTAITCAFCGPIGFIGLVVPHIARLMLGTSNHKPLLPVCILLGSALALLCNLICVLPGDQGVLPLNAITPIFGAPIIVYIIINQKKIQYFN